MMGRIGGALSAAAIKACGALPALFANLIGLAAVGLIAFGAWLIYPPAGFITGGALVLGGVLVLAPR